MKVTVILPTYNEIDNIIGLVHSIKANLPDKYQSEILVVDDDSPDGTYETVLEAFQGDPTVVALLRKENRGLANSIYDGIKQATGDKIIIMDTDFTHDPAEIPHLIHISEMYDLVSGSRFCPGGNMQDSTHYIASMLFNWFIRLILRTQVQDNLGGYFIIDRQKLLNLPLETIFIGYGDYFFRLLSLSQKAGFSIVEIPAVYSNRLEGESKSNFAKLLFSYTLAVFRFRLS